MASLKQSAILLLFIVHFRVTIGGYYYGPVSSTIDSSYYEKATFVSRSAVDIYNQKGESELIFVEYVRGTLLYYPYSDPSWTHPIWTVYLNAKNCSEPGNPTALYFAVLAENAYGVQFQGYGSNFTFFHLGKY